MKKIIINLFILIIILFLSLIAVLSSIGIETNKFNKLISDKVSETKSVNLKLDTIKFKINLRELSLFLETQNPKITYRKISIPVANIKLYADFISILNSNPKIKKTTLELAELDIKQLNKLSLMIKPSNLKSLINNKIKEGKLISQIEVFFTEKGTIKNFIAKGSVKNLNIDLFSGFNFTKGNLSFFADKNDILIKNIFGNLEEIKISDGDIKLNLENGIQLQSNFNSKFNFDKNNISKYSSFLNNYKLLGDVKLLQANLNNNIFVDLDNTYKIKDYDYKISGVLENGKLELINPIESKYIEEEIKSIFFSDLKISTFFEPNKVNLTSSGEYSFNNIDYYKINLENKLIKDFMNLSLDFDYGNSLQLDFLNYKKIKDSVANLSLILEKKKNNFQINKLVFQDGKNIFKVNKLVFNENKISSFRKIEVKTINNDFFIQNDKKILIRGNKFDATNLFKFFNSGENQNKFEKISNNIEIEFDNIKVPLSEKLKNFKLLGEIKKGKFVKISSKGDFGGNNFLDISMKMDKTSGKKYLEVYSDLTRPLLTEYSFFNGLSGGKLLFTSIIEEANSNSRLKIENFKIINAPGVIKLLSLADLGGLVDLVEGDGLSFDILEIEMEKSNNFLKLNEILALGPSMSVLMEGYQDKNGLTSLRGTLIPAKTLNKMISKIPIIGDIVIPKEVGEGLFGISFKMKGPKEEIKTTINPIKTLTPRFIQKIIEKKSN